MPALVVLEQMAFDNVKGRMEEDQRVQAELGQRARAKVNSINKE